MLAHFSWGYDVLAQGFICWTGVGTVVWCVVSVNISARSLYLFYLRANARVKDFWQRTPQRQPPNPKVSEPRQLQGCFDDQVFPVPLPHSAIASIAVHRFPEHLSSQLRALSTVSSRRPGSGMPSISSSYLTIRT